MIFNTILSLLLISQLIFSPSGLAQTAYHPIGNHINATTFEYDAMNRLVKTTDPLGKSEAFAYDANGNLIQTTDRRLQTIDFAYDAVNQLIKKTFPENLVTAFQYDEVGNLISVNDSDSALSFTYDALNRLSRTSTTGSLLQPDVTLDFTYDANSNRLSMTDTLTGRITRYSYDGLNRLTQVTDPLAGANVSFNYDALSRRTLTTLPSGIHTHFTYDGASQLKSIEGRSAEGTIPFSFSYTYDKAGNRLSLGTQRSGVSVSPDLNYNYDGLNRLIQATRPLSGQAEETFEYDLLGNRLLRDGQSAASLFDAANRLLEDSEFNYQYDANGNLTQKTEKATGAVTSYTYDAENQLIRIDLANATTAEYAYDGLGRRIQKNVDGTLTRYVYDNEDILLEFACPPTGCGGMGGELAASYTHGPGIDEPLTMHRGGQLFFYHTDGLGSITDLTSATGSLVQSYVYDSFGNITDQVGSISNPYTYTGREFDPESGLNYYRTRYQDPKLGLFIQEDPLGILVSPNLYSYTANNPITFVDPWGLKIVLKGSKEYRSRVTADIVQIRNRGPHGRALIEVLENSPRATSITNVTDPRTGNICLFNGVDARNGVGSDVIIEYDPTKDRTVRGDERPPFIGLAHEMAHARDSIRGAMRVGQTNGILNSEIDASRIENQIRGEHGIEARKSYGGRRLP